MKTLLIAMLMGIALPAFAEEGAELGLNAGDRGGDAVLQPEPGNGPGWGRQEVICVAANVMRQRFNGSDRNLQRAQRAAMAACQYGSGRFLARSCRLVRCENRNQR